MKREAGFTLLEVLVALAVLAIAMGAIISAVTQSVNTIGTLRDQTFAGWVALNKVNEWLLDRADWLDEGTRKGETELANRVWRWEVRFAKTADPDMRRLEVMVWIGEGGSPLSQRVAFRGRPPTSSKQEDPTQPEEPHPPERERPTPASSGVTSSP